MLAIGVVLATKPGVLGIIALPTDATVITFGTITIFVGTTM